MTLAPIRHLIVTADDFGVGPCTTRGILELAKAGVVTSTVLLVNSPYAEEGVSQWQRAGRPVELGWHPCLTLDAPVLPPGAIPSLVDAHGRFPPLGGFLKRLISRRLVPTEILAELRAQYRRFLDLVGQVPRNVNGHHHVHAFGPVGRALRRILSEQDPKPFVRRVGEPWRTLVRVPGARVKRVVLSRIGRRAAAAQVAAGFPGADCLIGITDPPCVHRDDFFAQWLRAAKGDVVELTCHPGYLDATLDGRDGSMTDGQLHRRAREFELLRRPAFPDAVREAGFTPAGTADLATCDSAVSRAA